MLKIIPIIGLRRCTHSPRPRLSPRPALSPLRLQLAAQIRSFPGQANPPLRRLPLPLYPRGQPPLLPRSGQNPDGGDVRLRNGRVRHQPGAGGESGHDAFLAKKARPAQAALWDGRRQWARRRPEQPPVWVISFDEICLCGRSAAWEAALLRLYVRLPEAGLDRSDGLAVPELAAAGAASGGEG